MIRQKRFIKHTFYDDGKFYDNISGSGSYSYSVADKKGLLKYEKYDSYEFEIIDNLMYVDYGWAGKGIWKKK